MATLGLFKIKVFWNKGYDVSHEILSRDSNYIVNVVMWRKFGNSSISWREVIITSILKGFDPKKNAFFEGKSWFKFNYLGVALCMALKFYVSVAKGLKLKVRKFLGIIFTFAQGTGENWIELKYWKTLDITNYFQTPLLVFTNAEKNL